GTPPSACFNTAMICASLYRPFFIVNLLRYLAEKILLLNTTNFRGDYPVSDALKRNFANYVVWKRPCRLNWLPEGLRAIEVCVIVVRLHNLR
ncbi:MAG: hypothetical protein ABJP04_06065, partial [Hyphomicrobiales bacterium]